MFQISLKAARVNARLTQQEAAKSLGISVPTYIAWEKNPENISALKQRQLTELFRLPIDAINFLPSN